jgi:hypothetical protein
MGGGPCLDGMGLLDFMVRYGLARTDSSSLAVR